MSNKNQLKLYNTKQLQDALTQLKEIDSELPFDVSYIIESIIKQQSGRFQITKSFEDNYEQLQEYLTSLTKLKEQRELANSNHFYMIKLQLTHFDTSFYYIPFEKKEILSLFLNQVHSKNALFNSKNKNSSSKLELSIDVVQRKYADMVNTIILNTENDLKMVYEF